MRYRRLVVCIGITVGIALAVGALTVSRRPPAGHTPLFGTAGSLRGTAFCRKYGCEYEGAEGIGIGKVLHFFRLLHDSTRRFSDPALVTLVKDLEGRVIQAELRLFGTDNPEEMPRIIDHRMVLDFMLLMVGNLGGFQDGPAPFFASLCGADRDGIYMQKFMLTKGQFPNGTPYFVYCLLPEESSAAYAPDNSIVWTVSMTDEEYRRR
ncbi:hypothetical protein Mterra_03479 [Calidithermus terrae]|uniref:Uncharacterized protein n=1 Tax=Calidithermus terrae TaxID=1408545 RepID=A0A399E7I6_9DEIN|nr:hypothetical protein [Calidithermus terrae]RIH80697.1 hypothetical protein Mterra_03479 [Calidithermus terrae]